MKLIVAITLVAIAGFCIPAQAATSPCSHSKTLQARTSCLVKAVAWEHAGRLKAERNEHGLTLDYISRVGAAISGHDPSEFRKVGFCESTDTPSLEEYGFDGAVGYLQYQFPTWRGTSVYRWFGGSIDRRKDALLEVVAAAVYLSHGGHWSGPWASSEGCHHL